VQFLYIGFGKALRKFPPLEPAAPIGDPPTQPENR